MILVLAGVLSSQERQPEFSFVKFWGLKDVGWWVEYESGGAGFLRMVDRYAIVDATRSTGELMYWFEHVSYPKEFPESMLVTKMLVSAKNPKKIVKIYQKEGNGPVKLLPPSEVNRPIYLHLVYKERLPSVKYFYVGTETVETSAGKFWCKKYKWEGPGDERGELWVDKKSGLLVMTRSNSGFWQVLAGFGTKGAKTRLPDAR